MIRPQTLSSVYGKLKGHCVSIFLLRRKHCKAERKKFSENFSNDSDQILRKRTLCPTSQKLAESERNCLKLTKSGQKWPKVDTRRRLSIFGSDLQSHEQKSFSAYLPLRKVATESSNRFMRSRPFLRSRSEAIVDISIMLVMRNVMVGRNPFFLLSASCKKKK